jgi:hypothetical protein
MAGTRVTAAGIRPHSRTVIFPGCSSLKEHLAPIIQKKYGKSPVQKAAISVGIKLFCHTNFVVVGVHQGNQLMLIYD